MKSDNHQCETNSEAEKVIRDKSHLRKQMKALIYEKEGEA